MQRKGFTIAELLITLGIIGVIAAVSAPTLSKLMPDKNKAKVLKAYNVVSRINKELMDTPGAYTRDTYSGNNPILGFADWSTPMDNINFQNVPNGPNKYGILLASKLQLDGGYSASDSGVSFTTIDGMKWNVRTSYDAQPNSVCVKLYITLDVNGDDGTHCSYPACNKPDVYKFVGDTYGNLSGDDPLTKAYLLNPKKLNDRAADLKKAEELK